MRRRMFSILLPAAASVAAASPRSAGSQAPPPGLPRVEGFTEAFSAAIREHRYLLMLLRPTRPDTVADKYERDLSQSAAYAALAGCVIYGVASLPQDSVAMKAATNLKVEVVPALSLIYPDTTQLFELDRFEGYYTPEEVVPDLRKHMAEKASRADAPVNKMEPWRPKACS